MDINDITQAACSPVGLLSKGTSLSGSRDTGFIQQADQIHRNRFFENIHLGLNPICFSIQLPLFR